MLTLVEEEDHLGTLKEIALGRSDIFAVHPSQLQVKPGWNSRYLEDPANKEHIESLALSIAEIGVREPLTVYFENDAIWISDGHCRHAAALLAISRGADIKSVPVKTEGRYSSEADRVFSQVVRNSGKPLTPYEQGRVFKRLIDYGWTETDISKKGGFSYGHVKGLLELQAAPQSVQEAVKTGEISATLARQLLLKMGGTGAAASIAEAVTEAKEQGKNRVTMSDVLKKPKRGGKKKSKVKSNSGSVSAIARARASGFWLNAADTEIIRTIVTGSFKGIEHYGDAPPLYSFKMSEVSYETIRSVLKLDKS